MQPHAFVSSTRITPAIKVWNKLDNMNEQLAIKRSMQLMSLFGSSSSSKDLHNIEPDVSVLALYCSRRLKDYNSFADLKT